MPPFENVLALKLYSKNGDVLLSYYLHGNYFEMESYFKFRIERFNMFDLFKENPTDQLTSSFILTIPYIISYIKKFYKQLQKCFSFTFDEDIMVYRGINKYIQYEKDYMFKSKTFFSTSINLETAYNFSNKSITDLNSGIILKIIIPKGTPICPILDISEFPSQQELLININSTFIVTKPTHKEVLPIKNPEKIPVFDDKYAQDPISKESKESNSNYLCNVAEIVLLTS